MLSFLHRKVFLGLIAGALALCASVAPAGQMSLLGAGKAGLSTTTFNPSDKRSTVTLSNGNLTMATSGGTGGVRSIASHSTGKYYFEATRIATFGDTVGIATSSWTEQFTIGSSAGSGEWGYRSDGSINNNGAIIATYATYAVNDVIGVAVDITNLRVYWRKNGTWQNSADPVAGTGGNTITSGLTWFAAAMAGSAGNGWTANFGASAYQSTAPTGYSNW
jgi:hypothetical protein